MAVQVASISSFSPYQEAGFCIGTSLLRGTEQTQKLFFTMSAYYRKGNGSQANAEKTWNFSFYINSIFTPDFLYISAMSSGISYTTGMSAQQSLSYYTDENKWIQWIQTRLNERSDGWKNMTLDLISDSNKLDTVMTDMLQYRNIPIYKNNTLINYSDGTYEVVDDVLSEQQAKEKAYKSLLDSYGSFYRASEKDISGSYSHINWGGGN